MCILFPHARRAIQVCPPPSVHDTLSYSRYRSLDCRHVGCFQCVLDGFSKKGSSCPRCNTFCGTPPQYDLSIEGVLFLLHKHIGSHHHTAESSGIDPKTFDKLYIRDREASLALRATAHQTQAAFVEAPHLTSFGGQTQVQVQVSGLSQMVGPSGVSGVSGQGHGLTGTAMEIEQS